jgi:hypothetical protein
MPIWYIFPFLVWRTKKNLATLHLVSLVARVLDEGLRVEDHAILLDGEQVVGADVNVRTSGAAIEKLTRKN